MDQSRGMSADTRMRLARYFGTSAEFWCNLQNAHDLSAAASRLWPAPARIVPLVHAAIA